MISFPAIAEGTHINLEFLMEVWRSVISSVYLRKSKVLDQEREILCLRDELCVCYSNENMNAEFTIELLASPPFRRSKAVNNGENKV